MNIQVLAFLLLIGRLVSDLFIVLVLIRQWKIRRTRIHPKLMAIRRILSTLAMLVFIGNLYPLWLDLVTLFDPAIRTSQVVNLKGVIYSIDNNFTFMFASILIYMLYRLADTVIEIAEVVGIKAIKPKPVKK